VTSSQDKRGASSRHSRGGGKQRETRGLHQKEAHSSPTNEQREQGISLEISEQEVKEVKEVSVKGVQ